MTDRLCVITRGVRSPLRMWPMTLDRRSRTQQTLDFEYDEGHQEQSITAMAGIPLLVQAFRSLGLPASVKRNVLIKQRDRGYDEATYIESFLILNAAGGECLDDFAHLRKDAVRETDRARVAKPGSSAQFSVPVP